MDESHGKKGGVKEYYAIYLKFRNRQNWRVVTEIRLAVTPVGIQTGREHDGAIQGDGNVLCSVLRDSYLRGVHM